MIEYKVKVHDDRTVWLLNGKLHREDGPAIIWADGDKWWYLNGKLHREDGPAIEYASGSKAWFLNGELHRVDGPAREWADGDKEWYLNDQQLTEQEFNQRTETKEITMAELNQLLGYNVKIKE